MLMLLSFLGYLGLSTTYEPATTAASLPQGKMSTDGSLENSRSYSLSEQLLGRGFSVGLSKGPRDEKQYLVTAGAAAQQPHGAQPSLKGLLAISHSQRGFFMAGWHLSQEKLGNRGITTQHTLVKNYPFDGPGKAVSTAGGFAG